MKKFFILIFLCLIFFAGCQKQNLVDASQYKIKCLQKDKVSCARYLFFECWQNVYRESYTTNIDNQNWIYWKNRYISKIETQEDAYIAIETMLASLDDPYTRFLSPDELEDQNMTISAQLSGIGVVISSSDGKIMVEDVIENSPAAQSDLKIGDIIMKIDDESISGLDLKKVADKIRGNVGTKVKLLILRENGMIEKEITRAKINIIAVKYSMIDDNIAYIKINTFMSQAASAEFVNALQATKGARAIIIDLRGNQGGLLQNATFIANLLLKKGVIVSILKKGGNKETVNVQSAGVHVEKPMVVLTNGLTASAGEILAAALQENGRALIVGEKTYGKGLIQKIVSLPLNTAVNVTIAKYLTPKDHDINKNGIKPDYEIKLTSDDILYCRHKINFCEDSQVKKAIELLK